MSPRVEHVYLVIRADHHVTLRKLRPKSLAWDEIAVALRLTFPDGWGRAAPTPIELPIPEMLPFVEAVVPVT